MAKTAFLSTLELGCFPYVQNFVFFILVADCSDYMTKTNFVYSQNRFASAKTAYLPILEVGCFQTG